MNIKYGKIERTLMTIRRSMVKVTKDNSIFRILLNQEYYNSILNSIRESIVQAYLSEEYTETREKKMETASELNTLEILLLVFLENKIISYKEDNNLKIFTNTVLPPAMIVLAEEKYLTKTSLSYLIEDFLQYRESSFELRQNNIILDLIYQTFLDKNPYAEYIGIFSPNFYANYVEHLDTREYNEVYAKRIWHDRLKYRNRLNEQLKTPVDYTVQKELMEYTSILLVIIEPRLMSVTQLELALYLNSLKYLGEIDFTLDKRSVMMYLNKIYYKLLNEYGSEDAIEKYWTGQILKHTFMNAYDVKTLVNYISRLDPIKNHDLTLEELKMICNYSHHSQFAENKEKNEIAINWS